MVTLDTFRALHEHDHELAAYCSTRERWAVLDLERLIAQRRAGSTASSGGSLDAATVAGREAGKCECQSCHRAATAPYNRRHAQTKSPARSRALCCVECDT